VRSPKKDRKTEDMTLFIMVQNGTFGVQKRPKRGLLASLWSFPNLPGKLDTAQALSKLEEMGLRPKALHRRLERSHIFTHIRWEMWGYYLEVEGQADGIVWMTPEQIRQEAALPTAFRQFWEAREDV
jgi:A/G-specific adenine glycosylase